MCLPLQRLQALLRLWMLQMPLALHKSQLELQWWWRPALHMTQLLGLHKSQLALQG
jgi:hypothetical protein